MLGASSIAGDRRVAIESRGGNVGRIRFVVAWDIYLCVTAISWLMRLAPLFAAAPDGWCGRKICDNQE